MEDDLILELYLNRQEDAIRETDAVYGRRLHALSMKILHSREDAEESVNDTYLTTWKRIPPHRPKFFFAFLASICRHISLNRLDWNLAEKRRGDVISLSQEMETCIPDTRRERELEGKELGRIFDAFLESLPKDSRLIFLRRYWYVDTISEIAQRYGMTDSKVKMQLSRTKAKLYAFLEKEGVCV